MTNTNYFFLFLFLFFLMGCKKDDKTEKLICGVKDPITELNWLAERIEGMMRNNRPAEIFYFTYSNGLEGFFIDNCVDCDELKWRYYDCEGNFLCGYVGDLPFANMDSCEVITSELIWEYSPEPEP